MHHRRLTHLRIALSLAIDHRLAEGSFPACLVYKNGAPLAFYLAAVADQEGELFQCVCKQGNSCELTLSSTPPAWLCLGWPGSKREREEEESCCLP